MNQHYPFELKPLPYLYDGLEPYIDMETMFFHHAKHQKTYVDNLNKALAPYKAYHDWSLEQLLKENEKLPAEIQESVRKNAGGVYNHQLYFEGMTRQETALTEKLKDSLLLDFRTWEEFYETFFQMALDLFGSGYLWLAAEENGKLAIVPLPNQDTPLPENLYPILNLDVWEHSYYLKHQNLRADYIKAWFHVINWEEAARRYGAALLTSLFSGSQPHSDTRS